MWLLTRLFQRNLSGPAVRSGRSRPSPTASWEYRNRGPQQRSQIRHFGLEEQRQNGACACPLTTKTHKCMAVRTPGQKYGHLVRCRAKSVPGGPEPTPNSIYNMAPRLQYSSTTLHSLRGSHPLPPAVFNILSEMGIICFGPDTLPGTLPPISPQSH